jgi:putative toxin-antitoxin system antitoxin component (TIGR02293 family)
MKMITTAKAKRIKRKGSFGIVRARRSGKGGAALEKKPSQVVSTEIHGEIIEIKKGYSIDKFEQLKDDLGVSKETLAKIASISLATMHRRKISSGRLTSDESEKIYRLKKLWEIAVDVLENRDTVKAWFSTPQIVFEGKTPLEYADTLPGSEEVERVLRRMEHGIIL